MNIRLAIAAASMMLILAPSQAAPIFGGTHTRTVEFGGNGCGPAMPTILRLAKQVPSNPAAVPCSNGNQPDEIPSEWVFEDTDPQGDPGPKDETEFFLGNLEEIEDVENTVDREVVQVPEPGTLGLLGAGLLVGLLVRRKRR